MPNSHKEGEEVLKDSAERGGHFTRTAEQRQGAEENEPETEKEPD